MATLAQNAPFNPTTANIARIDEWLDHLANEVDVAAHSDALTRYFETLARFWNYSARNCYLIAIQMPTATRVASRKTWESLGRHVKTGQWRSSLQILCPHFRKELDKETGEKREVLSGFSTGFVFDYSATEGAPLASVPWLPVDGDFSALYTALLASVRAIGIVVDERDDMPEGLHGFSTGTGTIVINAQNSLGSRCATLLHELAHERCHDITMRRTFNRAMLECQAESISYCCCNALGIPTPNTPTYLALYRIDRAVIVANLEAIRSGVARILRDVEHLMGAKIAA
jgi:hypothetical protein